MRKLGWIFVIFMVFGAIGNLIGGTDTPVNGATGPTGSVPASSSFNQIMYVNASALNLREMPSTRAGIIAKLPRNSRVRTGQRRNGWFQVSTAGGTGWVSGDYLSATPISPAFNSQAQQVQNRQPIIRQTVQSNAASCGRRKYCSQIRSCSEAVYYLRNCSWGGKLDGDDDGVPCESICR